MPRTPRRLILALAAAAPLGLVGCAALNSVHGEVSSFGSWPQGRAAGSYRFERLPSQQSAGAAEQAEQAALERGAAEALAAAGFTPAAEGAKAEVVVQLGARITRQARSPWDDPLWWRVHGPLGWRGWAGYPGAWRWNTPIDPEYDREAALLLRDAASGEPLYEARARNSGGTPGGTPVLGDLFRLAMSDFPAARPEPHGVTLPGR